MTTWVASLVLIGGLGIFKALWDVRLCMDDGAADQGSQSAQSFCRGWQGPDQFGWTTWLLPFLAVGAGAALPVAMGRTKVVLLICGAGLLVQLILIGISLAAR